MGHGKIIGVDDEELRISRIAQAFGYRLILGARSPRGKTQEQAGHGKTSKAHRKLQQLDLVVKRSTTVEVQKGTASSYTGIVVRAGVWFEELFTIAARMVYTQNLRVKFGGKPR